MKLEDLLLQTLNGKYKNINIKVKDKSQIHSIYWYLKYADDNNRGKLDGKIWRPSWILVESDDLTLWRDLRNYGNRLPSELSSRIGCNVHFLYHWKPEDNNVDFSDDDFMDGVTVMFELNTLTEEDVQTFRAAKQFIMKYKPLVKGLIKTDSNTVREWVVNNPQFDLRVIR